MKKSKLLKSLAALAVGILTAISCIGLVACGGGDPAVNSVRLNKSELTLKVGGNETLTATTDPAGATVTWTSADSTKVEVDQTGKVTAKAVTTTPVLITAKAGEKSATCNVTVEEAAPTWPKTNTFNWEKLKEMIEVDPPQGYNSDVPGNTPLIASYFVGENAFLTLNGDGNKLGGASYKSGTTTIQNSSLKAIELKDGGLSVTFEGTGTLTLGFSSTSSKNTSGLAVVKEDGTKIEATGTLPTEVKKVEADEVIGGDAKYTNEAGYYYMTGSTAVTLTFNITEAGTYTIWGRWCYVDGTAKSRGSRVHSIVMVDNGPQA